VSTQSPLDTLAWVSRISSTRNLDALVFDGLHASDDVVEELPSALVHSIFRRRVMRA
jgi:hypothetical protein